MQHDPHPSRQEDGLTLPPPLDREKPPLVNLVTSSKTTSGRQLLVFLLSVCLGLFLADGLVSLVDDSLLLFFGVSILSGIRIVVGLFTMLFALVVYVLMGVTPAIPKRFFVPLTLFMPVSLVLLVPIAAVFFSRMQEVAWVTSLLQVGIGLGLLYWVQGRLRLRWPMISDSQLGNRVFSWVNLVGFAGVNLLVLLPAMLCGLFLGASFAVQHLSEGFMALRPGGITVEVREYVRDDGRTILLVPMAHVGESEFYRALSDSFPTNAVILMEGVTDEQNLLTNRVRYQRMASSLGLSEQQAEFNPSPTQVVHADVDVGDFAPETIEFLNLVMLGHAKGVTPEVISAYTQNAPAPGFETQLLEDLLGRRNRRLLKELHARLEAAEDIVVPWGAAHMPGIARGVRASGFRVSETRDYFAIRFGSGPREQD